MKVYAIALTAICAFTSAAFGLTEASKRLAKYETESNAASVRDSTPLMMPHFEIPMEHISTDFSSRLSQAMIDQLIFKGANGVSYFRWILNPEDTKWHKEIEEYFIKNKGLFLKKKYYFRGYRTASRSYFVEDINGQVEFSAKSSTNAAGGIWTDKKQTWVDALDSRSNADYINRLSRHRPFENLIIMDEPGVAGLKELDQGLVIRDLTVLSKNGYTYLPGFSALHEEMGRKIALKNGSSNPYLYWTQNYIVPTARAFGELAARTGLQLDSPHSQNILIELDQNSKPTGRIVIRDLADFYLNQKFITTVDPNGNEYLKKYGLDEHIRTDINAGFGPLHGNRFPSWVTPEIYNHWAKIFFHTFEVEFMRLTGLTKESFSKAEGRIDGHYFSKIYTLPSRLSLDSRVYDFWKQLDKYRQEPVINCSRAVM